MRCNRPTTSSPLKTRIWLSPRKLRFVLGMRHEGPPPQGERARAERDADSDVDMDAEADE